MLNLSFYLLLSYISNWLWDVGWYVCLCPCMFFYLLLFITWDLLVLSEEPPPNGRLIENSEANFWIMLSSSLLFSWSSTFYNAEERSNTNCCSSYIYFFYVSFSMSNEDKRLVISCIFLAAPSFSWIKFYISCCSYLFCSFNCFICSWAPDWWGYTDGLGCMPSCSMLLLVIT